MGIVNPVVMADDEHEYSKLSSSSLANAIINSQRELQQNFEDDCMKSKTEVRKARRQKQEDLCKDTCSRMSPEDVKLNEFH